MKISDDERSEMRYAYFLVHRAYSLSPRVLAMVMHLFEISFLSPPFVMLAPLFADFLNEHFRSISSFSTLAPDYLPASDDDPKCVLLALLSIFLLFSL